MTMLVYRAIVLACAIFTQATTQCPNKCSCKNLPRYSESNELIIFTAAKCIGQLNFTETFSNNTEEIVFENTDVDQIEVVEEIQLLSTLPKLTRMEFINCHFGGSIEDDSFDLLQQELTSLDLKSLKISRSNLTSLSWFNVTSLTDLDLSQNEITTVKNSFRTLSNLQVLNLSANHLNLLVEKSFSGLTNLKSLDLSSNQLKRLSDKFFLPLTNLQYLNVSKNYLEMLNEAWFGNLVHLQQLDVSENRLEKVIPGNLELPSLTRLFLAGNPILGISKQPTLLIGMGSHLQTVDASNTGLKKVPSALTHSIRTLKLSCNSIVAINCGDLDYYPLLQILDFTSNKLRVIEDDALGRLDSLTVLYLSLNSMTTIPKSLPEKLGILHLDRNVIGAIRREDFQGLKKLELLNLSDNNITAIEDKCFDHLLSLSSLDLSRNPLSIPAGLLTVPGKLQTLKLSGIPSLLPARDVTFPLTDPEYLITLDLSRSPGLAHQLLADTAALAASRELQELDLSESGLEYIRFDLLHYLPQLRVLHLKGNPLNCTDLQWLASWLRKQAEYPNRDVTCIYPAELWGTPLVDLQGLEFVDAMSKATRPSKSIDESKSTSSTTTDPLDLFDTFVRIITEFSTDSENITDEVGDISTTISNIATVKDISFEQDNYSYTNIPIITTVQSEMTDHTDNKSTNIEFFEITNATIATSHYYSEKSSAFGHPGMLILILGVLLTTAILTLLTKQFSKRRRRLPGQTGYRLSVPDIEVNNIPGVTELW